MEPLERRITHEVVRLSAPRAPGEPIACVLSIGDIVDDPQLVPATATLPPRCRFLLREPRFSLLQVGDLVALPAPLSLTVRVVSALDEWEGGELKHIAVSAVAVDAAAGASEALQ